MASAAMSAKSSPCAAAVARRGAQRRRRCSRHRGGLDLRCRGLIHTRDAAHISLRETTARVRVELPAPTPGWTATATKARRTSWWRLSATPPV